MAAFLCKNNACNALESENSGEEVSLKECTYHHFNYFDAQSLWLLWKGCQKRLIAILFIKWA